jgi:hypothetical protein
MEPLPRQKIELGGDKATLKCIKNNDSYLLELLDGSLVNTAAFVD